MVCGAPNARAGMKGVFALAGIIIPRTGAMLKESVIRGVASRGMLCSAYELGLGDDHDGIIEAAAGRADRREICRSARSRRSGHRHQGDAEPRRLPRRARHRARSRRIRARASEAARYDPGCRRFPLADRRPYRRPIGLPAVSRPAPPRRSQRAEPATGCADRLEAIGLRPISALVDITNFLTFDLNRPLHVFDASRLDGDLVVAIGAAGRDTARAERSGVCARPGDDRDRRSGERAQPRRRHRRRERPAAPKRRRRSLSRRLCSIRCAPPPPAGNSAYRATRAIASSAGSIRPLSGTGSKSRPG